MFPALTTRSSEPTSIASSIRTLRLATGLTDDRGLLDTSVAVDLGSIDPARFPTEIAISALTLAELTAGPHAASDEIMRARRQLQLQNVEANFETIAFDPACARAYGQIYASVDNAERKPRGARGVDLMIAATALTHDLPLYTRNAKDLHGLDDLIEIVDVSA
jgi:predicted nucleic acid-binding protein